MWKENLVIYQKLLKAFLQVPLQFMTNFLFLLSTLILFKQEQELYDKEGLGVKTVTYIDNQDCIGEH